ncbi:MAG: rhamnogalacturonan lyase [Prevotella sp.]|nr:rhamnogalacturonan lyase [Prevotella sp.]
MKLLKTLITTAFLATAAAAAAQSTPAPQIERLDRGVVALPTPSRQGNFVSWRVLATDNDDTRFDLLRDGTVIAEDLAESNYSDLSGTSASLYQVRVKTQGQTAEQTPDAVPWDNIYMKLTLDRPANQTMKDGSTCSYSPNDCSVGDVDGDGQYEIIVKWDPDNSKDNSQDGQTGNVFLDCYKLSGEKLWRVDLGPNIRAGAHYTQFLVYDFDGDGRAEMMCKTGPGSRDGQGAFVSQAATDPDIIAVDDSHDWGSSKGRITGGQEYLTVFEGTTGRAIHTIFYNPNRDTGYGGAATGTFNWDDRSGKNDKANYGNRGERFLACVACLDADGSKASGVFCRGYYTYAFVWAVDFNGTSLSQRWLHSSRSNTQYSVTNSDGTTDTFDAPPATSGNNRRTLYANGNHNLSVADVDGDGKDEIIWGAAALDDNGRLLYATGFGHGDAMHLSDLNPDRPGLEVFQVHEDKETYSWDVHDAATGEVIFKGGNSGKDNGRGIAAQLDANHRGFYFSSSDERQQRSAVTGEIASEKSTSLNFRIYWDGTAQDNLLDGAGIASWNGNGTTPVINMANYNHSSSCNSTKKTPCLQADIFGDWREEVILWNSADGCTLNIFTTNLPTPYRVPTLMHDHTYRLGVAWQQTAYNQPPHLGFYLPDFINGTETAIHTPAADTRQQAPAYNLAGQPISSHHKGIIVKKGKKIRQ